MNEQLVVKDNGNLQDLSVADLLSIIGKKGITGMLRVEKNQIIKVIYLKEGQISFASSNDPNDRLGEVLIKLGKITKTQLDDAIQRLKPNISLGKMLVQLGYLSGKDLLFGAQKQSESIIISLFDWSEGNYSFIEGPLPKQLVDLKMDLNKILFKGITENSTREWIVKHITSMESIFKLKERLETINEKLQLTEDETFVISMLNGKKTLSEISSLSKLDDFQICKIATALKLLDYIEKVPPSDVKQESQEINQEILEEKKTEVKEPIESIFESKESYEETETKFPEEQKRKIEAKPVFPFLDSETDNSKKQINIIEEKDTIKEVKEEIIDKILTEHESSPKLTIEENEYPQEKSNKLFIEKETATLYPEEKFNTHIDGDELIFHSSLENKNNYSKNKHLKLSIIGLIVISAIIIALVYYIRYKDTNELMQFQTKATKEELNKETSKLPKENIAIVSVPKPKESIIIESETKNTLNEINNEEKGEPKVTTPNTLAKEAEKDLKIEKEVIKETKDEKEVNEWKIAQSLFNQNDFLSAANNWKKIVKKSSNLLTIQVELACKSETIIEAYNSLINKDKFYIIPKTYKNQQCFTIGYGVYSNKNDAETDLKTLPQLLLQQQFPPRIVYISSMLK